MEHSAPTPNPHDQPSSCSNFRINVPLCGLRVTIIPFLGSIFWLRFYERKSHRPKIEVWHCPLRDGHPKDQSSMLHSRARTRVCQPPSTHQNKATMIMVKSKATIQSQAAALRNRSSLWYLLRFEGFFTFRIVSRIRTHDSAILTRYRTNHSLAESYSITKCTMRTKRRRHSDGSCGDIIVRMPFFFHFLYL